MYLIVTNETFNSTRFIQLLNGMYNLFRDEDLLRDTDLNRIDKIIIIDERPEDFDPKKKIINFEYCGEHNDNKSERKRLTDLIRKSEFISFEELEQKGNKLFKNQRIIFWAELFCKEFIEIYRASSNAIIYYSEDEKTLISFKDISEINEFFEIVTKISLLESRLVEFRYLFEFMGLYNEQSVKIFNSLIKASRPDQKNINKNDKSDIKDTIEYLLEKNPFKLLDFILPHVFNSEEMKVFLFENLPAYIEHRDGIKLTPQEKKIFKKTFPDKYEKLKDVISELEGFSIMLKKRINIVFPDKLYKILEENIQEGFKNLNEQKKGVYLFMGNDLPFIEYLLEDGLDNKNIISTYDARDEFLEESYTGKLIIINGFHLLPNTLQTALWNIFQNNLAKYQGLIFVGHPDNFCQSLKNSKKVHKYNIGSLRNPDNYIVKQEKIFIPQIILYLLNKEKNFTNNFDDLNNILPLYLGYFDEYLSQINYFEIFFDNYSGDAEMKNYAWVLNPSFWYIFSKELRTEIDSYSPPKYEQEVTNNYRVRYNGDGFEIYCGFNSSFNLKKMNGFYYIFFLMDNKNTGYDSIELYKMFNPIELSKAKKEPTKPKKTPYNDPIKASWDIQRQIDRALEELKIQEKLHWGETKFTDYINKYFHSGTGAKKDFYAFNFANDEIKYKILGIEILLESLQIQKYIDQ